MVKYLYARNIGLEQDTTFFRDMYLASLRAFNNFYEHEPHKLGAQSFLESFQEIIANIADRGYDKTLPPVRIDERLEVLDGAHRVAACAALGRQVCVSRQEAPARQDFDFQYFKSRGFPDKYADFAAMEFVRNNPRALVVTLHAVNATSFDPQVEEILSRHGTLFYKKPCFLNFNGYVNLKKISYSGERWIGSSANGFKGARRHAGASFGPNPLRAHVFVETSSGAAVAAKAEIRKLLGSGNETVHITDDHAESIELVEALLNDNSIYVLNSRPFDLASPHLDERLAVLARTLEAGGIEKANACVVGRAAMAVFGMGKPERLEFVALEKVDIAERDAAAIAVRDEPVTPRLPSSLEVILNPDLHFYFEGFKFCTLSVLAHGMRLRGTADDLSDRRAIIRFRSRHLPSRLLNVRGRWRRARSPLQGLHQLVRRLRNMRRYLRKRH